MRANPSMVSARTGSAPVNASSHVLRSRSGRSSAGIFATHRSKAKFGPPLMVALSSEIARSHRLGRFRKASGDMKVTGNPPYAGSSRPPISPMSWYGGSQMTAWLSGPQPKLRRTAARLCSRLAWLSMTPLGWSVDPEVYWRNAMSDGSSAGLRHSCAAAVSTSSTLCQDRSETAGAYSAMCPRIDAMNRGASTTAGRASSMTPIRRGSVRCSNAGFGGYTGTAMTPAYRQAKKEAT